MTLIEAAGDLDWRLQDNDWLILVEIGIESIIVYTNIDAKSDIPKAIPNNWLGFPIIIERV